MRLLIATSTFPLHPDDGLPRFVHDLAMALCDHASVTVLAPHAPGAPHDSTMGPLTVKRFQYAWPAGCQRLAYGSGMRDNLRAAWPAWALVPGYLGALGAAVRRLVRQERFDVVNSHWVIPQGFAVSLALGRNPACAHVVTAHAGDVMMLEKLPLAKQVCRLVQRRTEIFLPVGDHVGRRLQRLAGEKIACRTQPMGVDYEYFSTSVATDSAAMPFEGNFILFVGRLVPIKGVDVLLDAMPGLFDTQSGLGLVVAGSGVEAGRLKAKARQMGIGDRVMFTGRLDHTDLLPYLQTCRVMVLPSLIGPDGETEGSPTVLAEALAAGCKVVAFRSGGAATILQEGYNGWLARANDAPDLAAKLSLALNHQHDDIRSHAQKTAREMDWRKVARCYMAHFETARQQWQMRTSTR